MPLHADLAARGITLEVTDADRLHATPASALTVTDLERLRRCRDALLEAITRPVGHSPTGEPLPRPGARCCPDCGVAHFTAGPAGTPCPDCIDLEQKEKPQ